MPAHYKAQAHSVFELWEEAGVPEVNLLPKHTEVRFEPLTWKCQATVVSMLLPCLSFAYIAIPVL